MNNSFIKRFQQLALHEALNTRRVVLLAGARQCGKTTISKGLKLDNSTYRTLDDDSNKKAAQHDPEGFIQSKYKTMIIDEIQRVPTLLTAIKKVVDEDKSYGQFLLTGSANLNSLPSVQESLAGRIRKIRLRTLTQAEILNVNPNFLINAFNQNFNDPNTHYNKAQIIELCFRGGYPEVLSMSYRNRISWHQDYVDALLEKDLKDVSKIYQLNAMKDLVKILCSWSAKFIDISAIGSHLAISRVTLESYFNALENLFIVERVSPWIKVDYQRIGRHPKLFITDTGLVCSILRWQYDQVLQDSDRAGKILETFVFNELATLIDVSQGEFILTQYRDRNNREVDFIIERDDGSIMGIEVKASSSVSEDDFKTLFWMQKNIKENQSFVGIVFYTGSHILSFGKNFWAVPISSMWNN